MLLYWLCFGGIDSNTWIVCCTANKDHDHEDEGGTKFKIASREYSAPRITKKVRPCLVQPDADSQVPWMSRRHPGCGDIKGVSVERIVAQVVCAVVASMNIGSRNDHHLSFSSQHWNITWLTPTDCESYPSPRISITSLKCWRDVFMKGEYPTSIGITRCWQSGAIWRDYKYSARVLTVFPTLTTSPPSPSPRGRHRPNQPWH